MMKKAVLRKLVLRALDLLGMSSAIAFLVVIFGTLIYCRIAIGEWMIIARMDGMGEHWVELPLLCLAIASSAKRFLEELKCIGRRR